MRTLGLFLFALAAACTTTRDGADVGAHEFADPSAFYQSQLNTCHEATATPDPTRIDPGYNLYGVLARERTWGGTVERLEDAVGACLTYYMRQPESQPFDPSADAALALYDFLASVTPAGSPTATMPMTIVEDIKPIAMGDATRGEAVYKAACVRCHGEAHTGRGSIIQPAPVVLPEFTSLCVDGKAGIGAGCYQNVFPGVAAGLVVIEKTRHGRFFNIGGTMPFYSVEALTDAQIGDMLAYLNLPSM
jgi:thiosulfate dehydrogenase